MQNDGSVSPVKQFLRNKWVKAILIIDVIAVIIIAGVFIFNATKSATISFSIAPLDAKIQVDGQGEYYNGSYQFHPGTHEITVSREGLTPKTFTIEAPSGYNTTLAAFLSDDGNFEFYELVDNYDSFQKLASIASIDNNQTTDHDTSAEQFIADYQEALELYQTALPIEYAEYNGVNYLSKEIVVKANNTGECQKYLCLTVAMIATDDENLAKTLLEEKGFNLEDYEIKYKTY